VFSAFCSSSLPGAPVPLSSPLIGPRFLESRLSFRSASQVISSSRVGGDQSSNARREGSFASHEIPGAVVFVRWQGGDSVTARYTSGRTPRTQSKNRPLVKLTWSLFFYTSTDRPVPSFRCMSEWRLRAFAAARDRAQDILEQLLVSPRAVYTHTLIDQSRAL
jgi:hypothetical protein